MVEREPARLLDTPLAFLAKIRLASGVMRKFPAWNELPGINTNAWEIGRWQKCKDEDAQCMTQADCDPFRAAIQEQADKQNQFKRGVVEFDNASGNSDSRPLAPDI